MSLANSGRGMAGAAVRKGATAALCVTETVSYGVLYYAFGVLLPAGIALRGLFLIDRDGVVRHAVVNDLPLGRSVGEAIRMVQALQHFEQHGEVCPANWQSGARTIKPTVSDSKTFFNAEYAKK